MVDNQDISCIDAIKLSGEMIKVHKMDLFILWHIASRFTFGLLEL